MEYIAEAMQASIDLTRTTVVYDGSNASNSSSSYQQLSRPSSSASSSSITPPFPALPYHYQPHHPHHSHHHQHHPGLDTNLTIFYRPVYPGNSEQQSVFYAPQPHQYSVPSLFQERQSTEPATGYNSSQGESHYDHIITNGMRVMHFMDHHPPDVFHQYPSLYLPDSLATQYASSYNHSNGGGVSTPEPQLPQYVFNGPSSHSAFSPLVPQVVQTTPCNNTAGGNSIVSTSQIGFQPYQPLSQSCPSASEDSLVSKQSQQLLEQKAVKRKNSGNDETPSDLPAITLGTEHMPVCAVCGDASSGVHYGVWACEGCKGFFRRALTKKAEDPPFACFYGSECNVNRENRNKCRACRLRRCYEVGMAYGVGRDVHRKRRQMMYRAQIATMAVAPAQQQPASATDVKEWLKHIMSAHSTSFIPVSDVFTSKYAAVLSLGPDQLWPPGGDLSKRGFEAIENFAQSLPFVSALPSDLRTVLLKCNALDVMLLRVTFRYCLERDSFLFPPAAEVTLPCLSATLLGETVANRLAFFGRFVARLCIGSGSEELAFLSTLALVRADALGDRFPPGHATTLQEVEHKVLQTFLSYTEQRWPSKPFLIGKLLAMLSDVRSLQHSVAPSTWLQPTASSSQNSS